MLEFAGEPELFDVYNRLATYEYFVREPIHGGIERHSMRQLHERAQRLAVPALSAPLQLGADEYLAAEAMQLGTTDTDVVLTAAVQGLVEALLLPAYRQLWGTVNERNGNFAVLEQSQATGDRDVGNFAAVHVLRNGGRVHVTEFNGFPEAAQMAAILRAPASAISEHWATS